MPRLVFPDFRYSPQGGGLTPVKVPANANPHPESAVGGIVKPIKPQPQAPFIPVPFGGGGGRDPGKFRQRKLSKIEEALQADATAAATGAAATRAEENLTAALLGRLGML